MPIDPERVQEVFLAAVEAKDPAERAEFLNSQCAGNAELRARVETLLQAHDQAGDLPDVGRTDLAAEGRTSVIDTIAELAGKIIGGRYKLLEQIGEGGFGVVFMADQLAPVRRRLALKIIKPGMDTRQVLARFDAERQALALMDHPGIARALDARATDSGHPYFVMEPNTGFASALSLHHQGLLLEAAGKRREAGAANRREFDLAKALFTELPTVGDYALLTATAVRDFLRCPNESGIDAAKWSR